MAAEKPDGDAPDYGPRLAGVRRALDTGNVQPLMMRDFSISTSSLWYDTRAA